MAADPSSSGTRAFASPAAPRRSCTQCPVPALRSRTGSTSMRNRHAERLAHILTLATLLPTWSRADAPGWYPFIPNNDTGPSVLGMEDWLDRPAGKHGRIARRGELLLYDGRPIKLWGLN